MKGRSGDEPRQRSSGSEDADQRGDWERLREEQDRALPSHRWAPRWTEAMHHSFRFFYFLSILPFHLLSVCLRFCSPLIYCWSGWRNDPGAFHSVRRKERQHSENGNTFCQRGVRKKTISIVDGPESEHKGCQCGAGSVRSDAIATAFPIVCSFIQSQDDPSSNSH